MPHHPYEALYIHIPFCASKCHYCDFDSLPYRADDPYLTEYFESLITQIRQLSKEGELARVRTVYMGGGTPTHAGSKHLTSLLYALGVSMDLAGVEELTVEANPESLTEPLVRDLWALGANRISLGVQTFDDELLTSIGRPHDGEQAVRALEAAQTRFANVSMDLMCGLPGQTVEGFEADVRRGVDAGVSHLSVYPLSLERGTRLYKRRRRFSFPDEDAQADMMESAERILEGAGLARYEVASYARPGAESKHNSAYWQGVPYLGIGRSAVTMTQNDQRRMRVRDGSVEDDLDAAQMAAEDAMLAMRMTRGLAKERAARMHGLLPDLPSVLQELATEGLIQETGDAWRPTHRGWLFGNRLFGALLDLAS